MDALRRDEILANSEYEKVRDDLRRKIMRIKRDRIVSVGDHVTFHFESRDTMRYQVQEMMRVEGLSTDEQIQGELDAYNPLIPGRGELSVTMMIEYETPEERAKYLPLLAGIDRHTFIRIGDTPPIPGDFDRVQLSEGKASSVQYVKFRLSEQQVSLLAQQGTVVRGVITHPQYQANVVFGENVRQAIQSDPL